jgi:hypothetical protein
MDPAVCPAGQLFQAPGELPTARGLKRKAHDQFQKHLEQIAPDNQFKSCKFIGCKFLDSQFPANFPPEPDPEHSALDMTLVNRLVNR